MTPSEVARIGYPSPTSYVQAARERRALLSEMRKVKASDVVVPNLSTKVRMTPSEVARTYPSDVARTYHTSPMPATAPTASRSTSPVKSTSAAASRSTSRVPSGSAAAKSGAGASDLARYGKMGLGGLAVLGGGAGLYHLLRSRSGKRKSMQKKSSYVSTHGMPKDAVQSLLKTASARLLEQEQELSQYREWYNEAQNLTKAASVADRLVASGHLDYADRDNKAVELASDPERLPIVEEAINMMHNPSAFSVASISDEYSDARTSRSQLESYLLGH